MRLQVSGFWLDINRLAIIAGYEQEGRTRSITLFLSREQSQLMSRLNYSCNDIHHYGPFRWANTTN